MKLLMPSSARSRRMPRKKQLSGACQQIIESCAVHDSLGAQAENKDAHNVLIYSEVENYFSATSGNQPYPT